MSDSDFQVTQKQAAEYLNVSTKTISRYRKKGLPYKMILNPVTGKQEVRFREEDLRRWHDGRNLLATYGQEGNAGKQGAQQATVSTPTSAVSGSHQAATNDYLAELLEVYKEQIQLLREQLEDMRGQLARRDRQIDDLMRLMVGLQLEYNPEPAENMQQVELGTDNRTVDVDGDKKIFSKEELSESVLRLRQRGKSYAEIARGLNHINAATLSGTPLWSAAEVQSLLPSLVDNNHGVIEL
ncbi:helix-turn-helix domain-containing protein [Desulfogranum marinum]|uniref:helix-turn-helix domain-containing protein n=1 Tax=Desulfogranum marinum TaxID=453220 RepID=UPI00196320DF|nr:helix-turn-helix domain-containing protein [Desulfogranum marinum]MBM9511863.1 helix-turn-helix domain-containing protein [Desulfogranum marinum]